MKWFILGAAALIGGTFCGEVAACDTVAPPRSVQGNSNEDLEQLLEKRALAARRKAAQPTSGRRTTGAAAPPSRFARRVKDAPARRPVPSGTNLLASRVGDDAEPSRDPHAARGRTKAPAARQASPPAARDESTNDRIRKAAQTQKALAAENARLEAQAAELERWDRPSQEKFFRAFGTTDAAVRNRVLQRIDALIDRNTKAIATIAENINIDSFLENLKRK